MRRFSLAAIVLLAGAVGSARADITYQYVTDQSNYTASAGGTVTVYFFLQEQLSGTSVSVINNDTSGSFAGLYGAGFVAVQNSGAPANASSFNVATTGNSLALNTNATNGSPPGFTTSGNTSNVPNSTTQQGALENIGNGSTGPKATDISSIGTTTLASTVKNAIYLGSITLTAGAAGTVTKFTVESYDHFNSSSTGNTITSNSGFDLDKNGSASINGTTESWTGAGNNPFVFTVSVPEPSSMVLCGLLAIGGGFGVLRRRKVQTQAAEAAA